MSTIQTIPAIETRYKGYRFRSRTEARWAVFFDAMGWRWNYEFQGYVTDNNTPYLPDFTVLDEGLVEIKGHMPALEMRRQIEKQIVEVAIRTESAFAWVCYGVPDPNTEVFAFVRHTWSMGRFKLGGLYGVEPKFPVALGSARSARFEHGERPRA